MILFANVLKDFVEVIWELTTVRMMVDSQWGLRKCLRSSDVKVLKV